MQRLLFILLCFVVCSLSLEYVHEVTQRSVTCYEMAQTTIPYNSSWNGTVYSLSISPSIQPGLLMTFNFSMQLTGGPASTHMSYDIYNYVNNATQNLLYSFAFYLNETSSTYTSSSTIVLPPFLFAAYQGQQLYEYFRLSNSSLAPNSSVVATYTTQSIVADLFSTCIPDVSFFAFSPMYYAINITDATEKTRVIVNITRATAVTATLPITAYCITNSSVWYATSCNQKDSVANQDVNIIIADLEPGMYYLVLTLSPGGGFYSISATQKPAPKPGPPSGAKSWIQKNYPYIIIAVGGAFVIVIVVLLVVRAKKRQAYERIGA